MDTLLGENKLSDGGILCNKCFNKATHINKDLVYDLIRYNIAQVQEMVQNGSDEDYEPVETKTEAPRITPISQSVQFNFIPEEPARPDGVKDQIAALNPVLNVLKDSEVNALLNILEADEKVVAIAEGTFEYNELKGMVLATQKAILFVDRNILGEFKKKFPLTTITSIQHDSHLMSSALKVFTPGFIAEFTLKSRGAAKKFYENVEPYLVRYGNDSGAYIKQQQKPEPQQESVKKEDPEVIFNRLEKLGKLRDDGILTEEEFAEQKKKLLAKL
jgi:hypothetical protein